jgi:prevent-host-death family protein
MKAITVTEARRHFGQFLDAVQHEPLLIRRKDRDAWVVISAEEYGRIHGLMKPDPKLRDSGLTESD